MQTPGHGHTIGHSPRQLNDTEEDVNPFSNFLSMSHNSNFLKTLRGLPMGAPGGIHNGLLSVMGNMANNNSSNSSNTPTNASQLQGTTIGK